MRGHSPKKPGWRDLQDAWGWEEWSPTGLELGGEEVVVTRGEGR